MSRDNIIAEAFRKLDRSLRKASIAQIGGFRPPATLFTSRFGGGFVGLPNETWPLNGGEPMLPILQVRIDELPYLPDQLAGVALFNVFVGPRELPLDMPAASGNCWIIRCYDALDGLVPLEGEPKSHLKPFPVRWSLAESDGPGWEDAWDIINSEAFTELPDSHELFSSRYQRFWNTKVGGWPSYIQPATDSNGFVFQIASAEKPNWMWGDNGNGYFYRRNGEWFMDWDCY